ncbi:unnamed protein product, partial [Ectocarpus sp. 12 AP-2014]
RYFENTETTDATTKTPKMRCDIEYDQRCVNLSVPMGAPCKYTKALEPSSREAKHGCVGKKTQVWVIRPQGVAWGLTYIGILEPPVKTILSFSLSNH